MPAQFLERRSVLGGGSSLAAYQALITGTSNLLAYWPMTESAYPLVDLVAGLNMTLSTGSRGAPMTYSDGPLLAQSGPLGSNAIVWDENNAGLHTVDPAPGAFDFAGTAPSTVELLGKFLPFATAGNSNGDLLQKMFSVNTPITGFYEWELSAFIDGTGWYLNWARIDAGASGDNCGTGYLTPANTWARYEFSYDGTNMRIYQNAAVIGGPTASPRSITAHNTPLIMGGSAAVGGTGWSSSPRGWSQAHTAVYSRVLTSGERASRLAILGY